MHRHLGIGSGLLLAGVLACAAPAPLPRASRAFVFQASFWVNLHHFLRAEARRELHGGELRFPLQELSDVERGAWIRARESYRDLSGRSLLFDEELVRINAALAGIGDSEVLPDGVLSPGSSAALERAAPLYRRHLWPEHRRILESWIAETEPLVVRHAAAMLDALAAAYRVEWPALPVLVDPCIETGPNLAYTTDAVPPGFAGLVTISPGERNRGPVAFECVFHEASHLVDAVLIRWAAEESARQGLEPPAELWHAILFFTSGVLAARVLGAEGTYRTDVRDGYPAYAAALERCWRPYLDGETSFEHALHDLVCEAERERAARSAGG